MGTRSISTFENISEKQSAYDQPADGPTLFRSSIQRRFQGALTGESFAELLICPADANHIGYVASDRFVGSFVFQHGGPIEQGVLRPFGYIVPGSGTGDLHGLRGEVRIGVTPAGEHTLTLDYDFER